MKLDDYQKLDEPKLILREDDLGFVLVTHMDLSTIEFDQINLYGKCYSYSHEGVTFEGEFRDISYSLKEQGFITMDEHGVIYD